MKLSLLNALYKPSQVGHEEYRLIHARLRSLLRRQERPAAALEELIASCDQFMCWAEQAKETLMDLRPARKERAARSSRPARVELRLQRGRARVTG